MRIVAFILLGLGVGCSLLNWVCLFGSWTSKRHILPVFPAPSILSALGLALLDWTRSYWWVGLLTDYTFFGLLISAPWMVAGFWRRSFLTRVQFLIAEDGPRRFELSLHRGGHFWLRATFDPPVRRDPHKSYVSGFGREGQWQEMQDGRLRLWGYCEERVLILEPIDADYVAHEEHYPANTETRDDAFEGLRFRRAAG